MALTWKDKAGLKFLGWRLGRMDGFKRWAPFVGTVITIVCSFLTVMGYSEQADLILRVVAFILPVASNEDQALATTAAVSAVGLVMQLVSRYKKASDEQKFIKLTR